VTRTLRVLLDGARDPRQNMALDELLLHGGGAALRLYGWQPAGLSLGRFQDPREFADVTRPHRLVRRVTGGGAIWHEQEITFALTLPADWLPADIGASYDRIHAAVARALAAIGVATVAVPGGGAPCRARPSQRWCFAAAGPHDLLTPAGKKLVGSAQRRIRRPEPRVLHHGSIVLRAPVPTPFAGAVAESTDPEAAAPRLRDALVAELADALGATASHDRLQAAESERTGAVAAGA
jgi:lipoate-protein ligase A